MIDIARVRSPARDEAFEIYKKHNGNIDLVEIAKMLSLSPGTIRGWKAKDKWDSELNGTLQKNKERSNKNVNKKSSNKEPIEEDKEILINTELTEKQRLFCIYYIEDFNATKAYKKAYDCSYATAMVEGSKSLRKPKLKKEIDRLTKECLEAQEVESKLLNKRLFEMYMKIAFADIGDYLKFGQEEEKVWSMNDDGSFKAVIDPETGEQKIRKYNVVNLYESEEVDTTIISEVSEGKDGVKIKLHDKMKALEWLDKHYGEGTAEQKLKVERLKLEISKLKGDDIDIEDTTEIESEIYDN